MPKDSTTDNPGQLGSPTTQPRPEGNEQQQQSPGQPSPGLKDKDAKTSDSYGNTRDSGEGAKR